LPRDSTCSYESNRSCIEGGCVVGAIDKQMAILTSNAPDEDRLKALKYLVHFVADVHQPLHAGFAQDRAGNTYQLQAYGRGTNLHSLWDSALLQQWPGGLEALRAAVEADNGGGDGPLSAGDWASASCRIVSTEGFYPAARTLSDDYALRWNPTLVQQLSGAGRRRAAVLNQGLRSR